MAIVELFYCIKLNMLSRYHKEAASFDRLVADDTILRKGQGQVTKSTRKE